MTATEQDQTFPERTRNIKTPVYERELRTNYSGKLEHTAEAALVWSSLKAGVEDTEDSSEKLSFKDQLKIIEKWDSKDDFYVYLEGVREAEQRIVDMNNPGHVEARWAQRHLDALAGIMGSVKTLEAGLEQASEGLGFADAARKRSELINLWIGEHNAVVDGTYKTPKVDTPEAPSPEAVNTSRENKEKVLNVLDMVVGAAKDHTYIHTDTRPIPVRHGREMRETERTGFQNFGDAPDVAYFQYRDALLDRETTEAVVFQPDTTPVYKTETYVVKTSLFGKQQTAERQIPNGESLNMVKNHTTGEEEPGVKMTYQFFANGTHYDNSILPRYQTSSGRPGNVLVINTVLPKSVAEEFKQTVQNNPLAARAFAEAVMFNNGVTEEAWTSGEAPMRPPYDALPADWTLSIIDTDPGYRGHDPNHTRRTKVPVATS
ncbi:MAG TPA: hypothetical protein PKD68_02855 [Candidatus Saccharibacteria bacterium]|nr:hypothetical protein [Candidatus Saccharibacteria bacterium]